MTRFRLFRLKNQMLFFNFLAMTIGVIVVYIVSYRSLAPPSREIEDLTFQLAVFFEPLGFLFIVVSTLIFEKPIRQYLDLTYTRRPIPPEIELKARQRLLNEPFFLIALSLILWLAAAAIYPIMYYSYRAGGVMIGRAFFQNILIGLVTTTAAFFILEYVLQKMMIPLFFPEGGLYMIPKTLRIRIRKRLTALIMACLIPFFSIIVIVQMSYRAELEPAILLDLLRPAIMISASFGIVVGICLTILVSSNITRPLHEIILVLKRIRDGHFDRKVKVTSNDEIGYTGDVINEMTDGLIERDRMRSSLILAREVQQHLLPDRDPVRPGLDIAGRSIYCDRTGGDYYDYLQREREGEEKIAIVVGDVSGHGISSALLMASVRSSFRQRARFPGGLGRIVTDVNSQLTRDVSESGQFMTLFFCELDSGEQTIRWVRAGHDPALVYKPGTDSFEELQGPGPALGLDGDWCYEELEKTDLAAGRIIVIGTDGIWEAHNAKGDVFGKEELKEIIRRNAADGAREIVGAVIEAVNVFRGEAVPEDDVTLVVIKVEDAAPGEQTVC